MVREELMKKLKKISEEIAKEKGYNQYSEYNSDCGIWDCKSWTGSDTTMSSVLEEEYGKLIEYKYHNGNPKSDFIGVRFRLSNPCLHMGQHNKNGSENLASIEFSDGVFEEGKFKHIGEYSLSEFLCWKPEGIKMGNMLLDKCKKEGIKVE